MALQGQLEMELSRLTQDEVEIFMEEYGITELAPAESFACPTIHGHRVVLHRRRGRGARVERAYRRDRARGRRRDPQRLARGFIRAEVMAYDDLIAAGDVAAARKAGKVRLEGKDYVVKNGDIVHIRFSV